jgi:hypothetical protein
MVAPQADSGGEGVRKRKLKNYFLDLRYQLRFTLIIVGVSAVLTSGLGWLVYHFISESSRVVYTSAAAFMSDAELANFRQDLAGGDRLMLMALIGFGVLLSLVLAAYGIVVTHKVAGPIYKITLYMNKIRDGRLGKIYDLRKGDQLVDFFETFKQMHEAMGLRTVEQTKVIERAIADAERHGATGAVDALKALKKQNDDFLA